MARTRGAVERPLRADEYTVRFATRDAETGWRDLVATARNAAVGAWEFLTATPTDEGKDCYRLVGDLGVVRIDGVDHPRWQYKPTRGGRIWYAVVSSSISRGSKGGAGVVLLEAVTTGHPNETIKNHR